MDRKTIVIRTRRHNGIIALIAGFFSRNNIRVERMFCSEDSCGDMLFTITCSCGENGRDLLPHIRKMHDVVDASYGADRA